MPWKESSVMDERLRFVARLLNGEPMTEVCRNFGISRKPFTRSSTSTRSTAQRRPPTARDDPSGSPISCRPSSRHASSPSKAISRIWVLGRSVNCWYAACPVTCVCRPRAPSTPCCIATGSSPRQVALAAGTPLSRGASPNELWCTDFKGEFKLGNGGYCYPSPSPITPRDTCCCARPWSPPAGTSPTQPFKRLFRERGLPDAIRSDDGVPFALSKIGVQVRGRLMDTECMLSKSGL
jgi:hypothetical protein